MNTFSALGAELSSLSAEARRKFGDVREAAERAAILCQSSEEALRDLQREDGPHSVLLTPILQGCQTKNAKIIVLSVACLQRLVAIRGSVTQHSAPAILQNLRAVLNQGVEIQLKILQTLVALLQNGKGIHDEALAETLLLCFKLQDSKIAQVASTAAGILRQLVIIIFEGVVAEDKAATAADQKSSVMLPDGNKAEVRASACDAFHVFQDLCILVGAHEASASAVTQPHLLKLTHLHKSLGIELIESILADFGPVFLTHPELIAVLRALLAPLVLKGLSERPAPFSSMTRFMRLGFLLMSKYHGPLQGELEIFLHLYIRVVDGTGPNGTEESWTRVLALEVIRGVCNDFDLLLKVWHLYHESLMALMDALGKVATEKPALLGSSSTGSASGLVLPGGIAGDAVNSVLEMAAQAATSVGVLQNAVGPVAGLSVETASVKQQCIDQLNKADPPSIPETYPYYLALQCLSAVANGFYGYVAGRYAKAHPPSPAPPGTPDFAQKPPSDMLQALLPVREMVNAAWPALLSSLAFFMTTNLDDTIYETTLAAHQNFTKTCGMLDLPTPRDAFLTSLCRFAVPQEADGVGLPERNVLCLRAVIGVAASLAGSLGTAWLMVFECLQNAETIPYDTSQAANTLFQKSKNLSETAFAAFVAALCRLNGEVIGMPVNERGSLDLEEAQSPDRPAPSPVKRRASAMTIKRTLKPGEKKMYGLSRLDEVAHGNLSRLAEQDDSTAWGTVVPHLLAVAHWNAAPSSIRLQAAEILDRILEASLRLAGEAIQTRVLEALSDQSEGEPGPQTSTDIEIRRTGLDTLYRMLESSGHALTSGWHIIFGILASACPGRLVKVAFPTIHLVCTDFLALLSPDELRICITTLADYGRQEDDVNIALTAGGLLWQVSDHLQSRKKDVSQADASTFSELWMLLLQQLLSLTDDERQEVRDGAIQTIFRSLELYGSSLTSLEWDTCVWQIVLPLLDALDEAIKALPIEEPPQTPSKVTSMTEALARPRPGLSAKQWDDSKILTLSSFASVFADQFAALRQTTRFAEVWRTLLDKCRLSFNRDHSAVAVAAMRSFARAVEAVPVQQSDLRDAAWKVWESAATDVLQGGSATVYTQAGLGALLTALPRPIESTRQPRLLELLRGILLYSKSDDLRPDVDAPNTVQGAVLNAIDSAPVNDVAAAAQQIAAYADFATLAFSSLAGLHATYVGLFKAVLPRSSSLIKEYIREDLLFTSGSVTAAINALATPMRLKYRCPSASKYGDDQALWKTAAAQFVEVARLCIAQMRAMGDDLPPDTFRQTYASIVEACRGALLADACAQNVSLLSDMSSHLRSTPVLLEPLAEQQEVEMLDLQILSLVELEVLPQLGHARLPDNLITRLADTLSSASRLYTLSLPTTVTPPATPTAEDGVESRFSKVFMRQADPDVFGTTADIIEAPKERVVYWSFDLLFQICRSMPKTEGRRRIARLALPILLSRCEACLRTYLVDQALRGRMPFPRVREEEIVYILDSLARLQIDSSSLARQVDADATSARDESGTAQQSSRGHLMHLHNLFVALLALPRPLVALPPVVIDGDASTEAAMRGIALGEIGRRRFAPITAGMHEMAARCLYEVGQELYR